LSLEGLSGQPQPDAVRPPAPRGCRHLRDLLQDQERSDLLYQEHKSEHGTIIADFSRQRVTSETVKLLVDLADKVRLLPCRAPHLGLLLLRA